jgi:hypothetical protein
MDWGSDDGGSEIGIYFEDESAAPPRPQYRHQRPQWRPRMRPQPQWRPQPRPQPVFVAPLPPAVVQTASLSAPKLLQFDIKMILIIILIVLMAMTLMAVGRLTRQVRSLMMTSLNGGLFYNSC